MFTIGYYTLALEILSFTPKTRLVPRLIVKSTFNHTSSGISLSKDLFNITYFKVMSVN